MSYHPEIAWGSASATAGNSLHRVSAAWPFLTCLWICLTRISLQWMQGMALNPWFHCCSSRQKKEFLQLSLLSHHFWLHVFLCPPPNLLCFRPSSLTLLVSASSHPCWACCNCKWAPLCSGEISGCWRPQQWFCGAPCSHMPSVKLPPQLALPGCRGKNQTSTTCGLLLSHPVA